MWSSQYRPRHARRPSVTERLRRSTWLAVPVAGVVALGAGVAVAWPHPDVSTAEPAAPAAHSVTPGASTGRPSAGRDRTPTTSRGSHRAPLKTSTQKTSAPRTSAPRTPAPESLEPMGPKLTTEAGRRWTEVVLNLRSEPRDGARTAVDVAARQQVEATGYTSGRWSEVQVDDRVRWVLTRYLATKKPAARAVAAGGGSPSSAPCPSGSAVESGLTPDAVAVHRAVCHAFPDIDSYGGVRADALPEHPSGRALDAMVSGAEGWRVAEWVRAHAKELGVSEVIHAQRIWTVQRSGEGWRSMSDRGSPTANHEDHVHVTVYGNAAG